MKSDDLVRELKKAGWTEDRISGSHHNFQASRDHGAAYGTASQKRPGPRSGPQDQEAGSIEMKFTIAIEAGTKKSAFGVVVPDLPGCFSAGDTIEEAFDKAREAIEAHCEILAETGKALPRPRPMTAWQADREYKGWTWGIVDVPVEKYFGPAEKINITVPASTLRRIDAYARKHGETRSGFLVKAAERAMRS